MVYLYSLSVFIFVIRINSSNSSLGSNNLTLDQIIQVLSVHSVAIKRLTSVSADSMGPSLTYH